MRAQELAHRADAIAETCKITIENGELGKQPQEPEVPRFLQKRFGCVELDIEIYGRPVEGPAFIPGRVPAEIGFRQQSFCVREKIHVIKVAAQIQVGSARLLCRHRLGQGFKIEHWHCRSLAFGTNLAFSLNFAAAPAPNCSARSPTIARAQDARLGPTSPL